MPDLTALREALELSVRAGYLGTTVDDAIAHSEQFVSLVGDEVRVLDLGSGGGVPGLVIAVCCPMISMTLLDNRRQRTDLLERLVRRLRLTDRVSVHRGDAELAGHDPELRGSFDTVTARSFGPAAAVAECAAPFLAVGGQVLVSEAPDRADRWPAAGLARVGLAFETVSTGGITTLRQVSPCPAERARRQRTPPLF